MRELKGTVVSNKMMKTLIVRVDRLRSHPKYRTYYRVSRKFKAHAEDAAAFQVGDVVRIRETRPISKEKRWRVVEVIKRADSGAAAEEALADESLNPNL